MKSFSSHQVLQGYFDDLLREDSHGSSLPVAQAADAQGNRHLAPAASPMPAQVTKTAAVEPAYADAELDALEQSKREKLQALLNSKPVALADVPVDTDTEPAITVADTSVNPLLIPVNAEPEPDPELMADDVTAPTAAIEPQQQLSPYLDWHDNGRPHWAQKRFDALLFDVAGLRLAVPLIALGQIHPLTDELTPLFGQADWFMGLLPTSSGKLRTINTALFVMPERYDPAFASSAKYVVSIDGLPWGLAVDGIHQPVTLDPDDVKWRTERSKRPWLAGTVKSAMCALIDIPNMGQLLTKTDKNHPEATR